MIGEKEGYTTAQVELPPEPSVLRLTLSPRDGYLEGVVVRTDGAPVAGVTVVAWHRSGTSWPALLRLLAATAAGAPLANTTHSAVDGTFRIDGLRIDREWTVATGGLGWISPEPIVTHCGSRISLRVSRAFGVRVRVRDVLDNPPICSPALFHSGCGSWSLRDPAPSAPVVNQALLALLGVPAAVLQAPSRWDPLLVYASESSEPLIGPIRWKLCLPGYHPIEAELWAAPVTDEIRSTTVTAQEEGSRWAQLSFSLEGLPPSSEGGLHTSNSPAVVVYLQRASNGDVYEFAVRDLSQEKRIGGLPAGAYALALEGTAGGTHFQDEARLQRLEVDAGEQRFPLDLSGLGFAVLELRLPGGTLYDGPAHFALLDGEGRLVRRNSFDGGPYRFAVFDTDRAAILQLDSPGVATVEPDRRAPLHVEPGASSTVTLSLLDTP